ncbi:MAG: VOC family protein, partial [Acidobacteriota bacterium]|nr:VOC family protein [Acidobacteriota bacterium]
MTNQWTRVALALLAVGVLVGAAPAAAQGGAAEADYNHVSITSSAPPESVRWYAEYLGCELVADRDDTADCFGVEVTFVPQPTMGSTQGTGVNHIGFSYADVTAKMAELEAVGVRGSGVRLQRFEDGSMVRDVPGLFRIAYIFDPWGTRIQLVEDDEYLGFHHIQL